MHPTIKKLLARPPIVTDGAWGTQLQALGLPVGTCPDLWNLQQPGKVEEVAKAYVAAGSHIILTNTFGSNRVRLAESGMVDQVAAINRAGAAISKKATAGRALVFGSMGPTGQMLLPGELKKEEACWMAFMEQAAALKAGGVDGLVIETMSDLAEALIALAASKKTGLPIVVCLVFDKGGRTMMGVTPEKAAQMLTKAGADVVGSNCGNGIAEFEDITKQLRAATDLPIWIKANAGLPELVDGKPTYRITPSEFASHAPALIKAGASFIGGCCGTTPAHIAEMCKVVR